MPINKGGVGTLLKLIKDRLDAATGWASETPDVFVGRADSRRSGWWIVLHADSTNSDSGTSRIHETTISVECYTDANTSYDDLEHDLNIIDGDEYTGGGSPSKGLHRWKPPDTGVWTFTALENLTSSTPRDAGNHMLFGALSYQCHVQAARTSGES